MYIFSEGLFNCCSGDSFYLLSEKGFLFSRAQQTDGWTRVTKKFITVKISVNAGARDTSRVPRLSFTLKTVVETAVTSS